MGLFSKKEPDPKKLARKAAGSAVVYASEKKYEQALLKADEAINLDSDNEFAWQAKATSLFSLERYGEAKDAIEKAVLLTKDKNMQKPLVIMLEETKKRM